MCVAFFTVAVVVVVVVAGRCVHCSYVDDFNYVFLCESQTFNIFLHLKKISIENPCTHIQFAHMR